ARLALERPVAMKRRWRRETPAGPASSGWVKWRRGRHARSIAPTVGRRGQSTVTPPYRRADGRAITCDVIAWRRVLLHGRRMDNLNTTITTYLELLNETDADRRMQLAEKV